MLILLALAGLSVSPYSAPSHVRVHHTYYVPPCAAYEHVDDCIMWKFTLVAMQAVELNEPVPSCPDFVSHAKCADYKEAVAYYRKLVRARRIH